VSVLGLSMTGLGAPRTSANAVTSAVTGACLRFAKLVRARTERSLSKIAHSEAVRTPLARLRPSQQRTFDQRPLNVAQRRVPAVLRGGDNTPFGTTYPRRIVDGSEASCALRPSVNETRRLGNVCLIWFLSAGMVKALKK
jgi:hypothetical protein